MLQLWIIPYWFCHFIGSCFMQGNSASPELSMASQKQPICFENLPPWDSTSQQRFIIPNAWFSKAVYDRKTDLSYTVKIPRESWIDFYKIRYKDSFTHKYAVIEEIYRDMPAMKPSVRTIRNWDQETIMLTIGIPDFKVNPNDIRDTMVFTKPLIVRYHPESATIKGIYDFSTNISNQFFVWNVFYDKGIFYGQGYRKGKNSFAVFTMQLDETNKQFKLDKVLPFQVPVAYKTRKVPSNVNQNIVIQNGIFAFRHHDSLTFLNNLRTCKLPIADNILYHPDPTYYMCGGFVTDDHYIYMTYFTGIKHKQIWAMRFRKDGTDPKIIEIDATNVDYFYDFLDVGTQVFYKLKNQACHTIEKLNYDVP